MKSWNIKQKNLKLGLRYLSVAHLFGLELFIKENLIDDNLYFDILPLQLISTKRLIEAINYVGVEKILFGTDTPYGAKDNLSRSITRINKLHLSDSDKKMILGMNIKRLLRQEIS